MPCKILSILGAEETSMNKTKKSLNLWSLCPTGGKADNKKNSKCKSYKLKQGGGGGRMERGNILNGMVRVGFFKKMIFEQRWDRREGSSHASNWWKDPSR